ncbi:MAG TPA: zinc-dependent metalloprotease [Bacteroidales bacterium]|jgi:hypothetical protein|nr:zinc-dependent metalloprotease [Bacteroidales bacterium]OQC57219.1 MAG: hypothetical protein BWX52_01127 [Bacteroidetes bacterium ADurb.Bin013]MBP8998817.1 zinc-dependent metalloprotease [Bacteroidales bacterium]MBV6456622.1 hypothetical protein [Bacteroidales bacterium]MCZ2317598.1 zinc-dependent metalloprotease [Bacteroidales bacterium]
MKRTQTILILAILAFSLQPLTAQRRPQEQNNTQSENKPDSKTESKGPARLEEFIKAETAVMEGMTPVYVQDKKYFIGIPDSLIGRDILMVTRMSETPAGFRANFFGYAGDQINSGMLRFEKGPDNNIFLTKVLAREQSRDSTQAMYYNVMRSNRPAIIASFDIKALNADSTLSLIDVTDLVKGDNESLYFSKRQKKSSKMTTLQNDKSYVKSVRTFPINTELRSVKSYTHQDNDDPLTFEINCSLVLLPKEPMQPRYFDERVGYFTSNYTDFDMNPQGIKTIRMIARWRLEPKPEDLEKYKRGELVEPAKPIIFYIDPSTPKEWVPYLIQGVNDWQPVFEKAGFKNAIYALEAPSPEEDPSWSLEDARNSAIVYKPSTIANASGPHVSDPRSGEIIESHINWYHNVMSLVHNWYFVQCSPVDPLARSMTFPSELMGQLVRFVSSHEVGHTLGLRHNFGATSYYTTEQLRDPEFLRANGHTASIMDYSRFNFVVQPEDNVSRELLFPRLSHYDNWAIEWGYRRLYQFADVQEEIPYLNQWVIEKTKDPYLRFNGGSESGLNDPRAQSEDLGDNQMETCELGIRNLKVIMQNLPEWTKVPNENYRGLSTLYPQITSQFSRYIGHVSKWVAGVYVDAKTVEQEGPIYVNVSKNKQKEAMAFLERHIFTTPLWLLPDYLSELLPSSRLSIMENLQNSAITGLVNENVLVRMLRAEEQLGPAAYSAEEFFKDMNRYVFGDYGQTDIYCRSLQNIYVNTLCKMITPEKPSDSATTVAMMRRMSVSIENNDVKALVAAELETIAKKLKRGRGDDRTRAHYNYLIKTIENL